MGEVINFSGRTMTRQQFIEDMVALGAPRAEMPIEIMIKMCRDTAWREAWRIAEACCESALCPTEKEFFPIVSTVDPAARKDLTDAASLVAACDLLIAHWNTIARHNPTMARRVPE